MSADRWNFSIDVGGTFTDVVARRPDGELLTYKLLSSGVIRGQCEKGSTADCIIDSRRIGEPRDLWVGYRLSLLSDQSRERKLADTDQNRDREGAGPLLSRHRIRSGKRANSSTPTFIDRPFDGNGL